MNRKLSENLASLYSVHVFNYLVPLLTLPYLARILGPVEWGAFAFADAYGRFVSLLIEYGFGLSATREVARVRDEPALRSIQLSGVLGAQLLLAVAALIATALLVWTVPVFSSHSKLLPGALFLAISQGATPMWYFQGIERVRLMGGLWVAGRIAGAAGLFLFVHSPDDAWLALFVQATAPFISVVAGLFIAYRNTPFSWPSVAHGWKALHAGGSLFLFRAGVSLYTASNTLILGFLAPPLAVGWFAGAEKIARAAVSGTAPITQAFYPRISHLLTTDRRGAAEAARLSMKLSIGAGVGIGALLYWLAPVIVRLALGPGFNETVPVLRLLAFLPPLIAVSNVFGTQWMLALRLEKDLNRIILGAGVVNVLLSLVFGSRFHQIGMAISIVLAEVFVTVGTIVALWWRGLGPWAAMAPEETEVAA